MKQIMFLTSSSDYNMKHTFLFTIYFFLQASLGFAQHPPLGLQLSSENISEGYTLFSPLKNKNTYLINNCGGVVNEWEFSDKANRSAYLLPNGNVVRAGAEFIEIRDWNNQLLWSYSATELEHHHDIEPMPNGNILIVSYDYYSAEEMESVGRVAGTTDEEFRLDKILEIKPVGSDDIEIVWQWKFYDHLVQDIDPNLPNYGVVAENPDRLDVNFDNEETFNFVHVNGIDYNPALDQIIFSARNLSEVFIIDHSTTSEEAANSTGGVSEKGGDFLWRWGNPQVYQQGSAQDQQLFRQHDPKWVLEGYQDEGSISLFNNHPNEFSPKDSHVELLRPEINDGQYELSEGRFSPADFSFSWSGEILDIPVYEEKQSGVLFLENGNFLLCESSKGRISEVTKAGEVVWVYKNPSGDVIYQDGDIGFGDNGIFRADRYSPDYLDFAINSKGAFQTIEDENFLSEDCQSLVTSASPEVPTFPRPFFVRDNVLEFHTLPDAFTIYALSGRTVYQSEQPAEMNIKLQFVPGLYLLKFTKDNEVRSYKILLN